MQWEFDGERPIFIQIGENIEDSILTGVFPEESRIPSITDYSVNLKINPATALKGINLLVDEGILYKKRGLGMFVATGAVEQLRQKRRDRFFDTFVRQLVAEARRLDLDEESIKQMIERGFQHEPNQG